MSVKSVLRALITMGRGVVKGIPEATAGRDPLDLFHEWFRAAAESGIFLPEAMALATASPDGAPSVRMVLLKGADADGFVFYTNYGSRKATELEDNPRASLCFHWAVLERQVRVEGTVERVSREESEAYFRTRARRSRLGAWASDQSRPLGERADLARRLRDTTERFAGDDVPLPDFWGGYRLRPHTIEFWQGKADRLHDRLVFEHTDHGWETHRLYP
ncbi:MAG: pyridoxamine 5'-phosphate oxidase [Gemmatimonadota bacterium]|nr:pyridoxamine 5'-phosphate oxidase [Gemmatimonadota bacterium]